MLHKFAFHNDRILPLDKVRLSPGQAGLINGWGVFSTLRIYDGVPFAFDRHWKRLAADAVRIQLPLAHDPAAVHACVMELLAANHISSGCVRIYLVYNKIGIWHSDEPTPLVDLLLYSSDLPLREGAASLALYANGRHAAHPLAGVKVTSWLANAWFLEQAHQLGFDDALLLNEHGNVSECTAANIFCVAGERVITPPLSSGCLPGVTRQILLEIASAAGIIIMEENFDGEKLRHADEVFITSTTRQVQAVAAIGELRFRQAPGPITECLAKAFSTYVGSEISRAASSVVGNSG